MSKKDERLLQRLVPLADCEKHGPERREAARRCRRMKTLMKKQRRITGIEQKHRAQPVEFLRFMQELAKVDRSFKCDCRACKAARGGNEKLTDRRR